MKIRSRILLAVIAVIVMTISSFAANVMRGGLIGKFSPSSVQDNQPPLAADETFPVSYDLRHYGRVSKVHDQSPWGTCWAFGATAAVESSYLTRRLKGEISTNLGNANTVDFSEMHMAWYVKNNPDKSRALIPSYRDLLLNNINGGFANMPMAYLVRLDGPVLDS